MVKLREVLGGQLWVRIDSDHGQNSKNRVIGSSSGNHPSLNNKDIRCTFSATTHSMRAKCVSDFYGTQEQGGTQAVLGFKGKTLPLPMVCVPTRTQSQQERKPGKRQCARIQAAQSATQVGFCSPWTKSKCTLFIII